MIKILIEDEEFSLDPDRLMLSESMAIEDEWGVRPGRFSTELTSGDPSTRVIGAMVWLVKVRKLALTESISFTEAAKRLPVATFDVNLSAIRQDATPEPPNPTAGVTPTPTTRTTRTTSARRKPKTV